LGGTDLELEKRGVSYLGSHPGFGMPVGHRHAQQEEVHVLLSGAARLRLDDDVLELVPRDAVRIDEETMGALEGGPDGAELILFGAPNVGPGRRRSAGERTARSRCAPRRAEPGVRPAGARRPVRSGGLREELRGRPLPHVRAP
jgi:hypothetical protein